MITDSPKSRQRFFRQIERLATERQKKFHALEEHIHGCQACLKNDKPCPRGAELVDAWLNVPEVP